MLLFSCEKKSAIIVAEKTSYFSATRATNGQISLQTAIVAEKMADFSASPARQGTRWCSGLLATIFLKHRSTRIHTDGASHFDAPPVGQTTEKSPKQTASSFYHDFPKMPALNDFNG